MPDFNDIASEYERIKNKPEKMDEIRVTENKVGGTPADALKKRENLLPTPETHHKLQEKYAQMFDKSSRAGAKHSGGGLILPGGRKNFADFHDNFTGTGRIEKKQEAPAIPEHNAPKVDTPQISVVLYKRCIDCGDTVNKDEFVYDMDFVPPQDRFQGELEKWKAVGLKPGMIVGSFFCLKCVEAFKKERTQILNDPFKNALQVNGPDGLPTTLAALEAEALKHKHRQRTRENIIAMIKNERNDPTSDCFYGEARLGN